MPDTDETGNPAGANAWRILVCVIRPLVRGKDEGGLSDRAFGDKFNALGFLGMQGDHVVCRISHGMDNIYRAHYSVEGQRYVIEYTSTTRACIPV